MLQAAAVAKLKLLLPTAAPGTVDIREWQYKGADFVYPNVRVLQGVQVDRSDGQCIGKKSAVTIFVIANSEKDASDEVNQLVGLISTALTGQRLQGTDWYIPILYPHRITSPRRANPMLWRGTLEFIGNVYRTN
jgi:hypothetical protein